MLNPNLKVVSVFTTLDGEVGLDGPLKWSTFVRTGGCNLRCWKSSGYCDAPHSLDMNRQYVEYNVKELAASIARGGVSYCTVTGGEPLMQREPVCELGRQLQLAGPLPTLETSGSILIGDDVLEAFSCIVMDVKPPSTEMAHTMKWVNFGKLREHDFIKVVVETQADLDWFYARCEEYDVEDTYVNVAIGPRMNADGPMFEPATLVEWMRERELFTWRLNLQMHKAIWETPAPYIKDLADVDYEAHVSRDV